MGLSCHPAVPAPGGTTPNLRGGAGRRANGCQVPAALCASMAGHRHPPEAPRATSWGTCTPPRAHPRAAPTALRRSPNPVTRCASPRCPVPRAACPAHSAAVPMTGSAGGRPSGPPCPRLPATRPYKGRGSERGTELTSCLCAPAADDYNREWEEEPLAPRQPSLRLPGAQDNSPCSHQASLGSGTASGDSGTGVTGFHPGPPNAPLSAPRLQEEIQLKEEAENNLAAFRAVSTCTPKCPATRHGWDPRPPRPPAGTCHHNLSVPPRTWTRPRWHASTWRDASSPCRRRSPSSRRCTKR